MRRDKLGIVALVMTLAMLAGVPALAQVTFQGSVVSSETLSIPAPFGGLVDEIKLRKGDPIHIGDPVATIRTTKVFADMDGTVSGIFAREGDQTEGITERYGAVMYIVTMVLSLRFLVLLRDDESDRGGLVCYHIALTGAFILVFLQLINRIELHSVLVAYGVFTAVLHLIVLFERKSSRRELIWGIPFLLMLGVDLLYLARSGSLHNAPFFMLWIIATLPSRMMMLLAESRTKKRVHSS